METQCSFDFFLRVEDVEHFFSCIFWGLFIYFLPRIVFHLYFEARFHYIDQAGLWLPM